MIPGTKYQLVGMDLVLSYGNSEPITLSIGSKEIDEDTTDFFNTVNTSSGPSEGYWTLSVRNLWLRRYSGDDTTELNVILQDNNEDFKELVNTVCTIGNKLEVVKENLQLKSVYKTDQFYSDMTLILNK